ncbi:hypothetical protein FPV67DRAFT_1476542 [Lyophyllum atratum]|nr:hypothetical protein FPV67DRAFT_1476542 [Lyophyllum atratum]
MPVAPYTLDDHFDLSLISLPEANSEPAASGHTSLGPRTAIFMEPADAQANSLKRSFQEVKADDSYPEIDPRLAKKPRIQAGNNSLSASESASPAQKGIKRIRAEATELETAYDQPESINGTALQSDYASPPRLNATRRAIKTASTNRQARSPSPGTSQHGSPDALASQPKYSSEATSTRSTNAPHITQSKSVVSNNITRPRHSFGNPRGFIIKVLKPPSEISTRPSASATPPLSASRLEVKTITSQYSRKPSELVMKSLISTIKSPGPQPSTQPTYQYSNISSASRILTDVDILA